MKDQTRSGFAKVHTRAERAILSGWVRPVGWRQEQLHCLWIFKKRASRHRDAKARQILRRGNKAAVCELEAFGMAAESRTAIVGLILDMIDGYALRVGLTGKKPSKKDTEALLSVVRCVLSMGGCEKGNHPMLF